MVDIDAVHKKKNNVEKSREMYAAGYTVNQISRTLNESPFLVAQWVKK